jgi:uncharacterized membrane protein YbaN (DUF454 family)
MKRILLEITGWVFIVLGIAGLFLPVLQGILFLLIGLTILSAEYHWARRWIVKLRERFPEADRKLRQFLGKYSKHIPGVDSTHPAD